MDLPLYEVRELTMEEALLVMAAEKERPVSNQSDYREQDAAGWRGDATPGTGRAVA